MFLVQAKEKDIAMSDAQSPSQASTHKHPTALLVTVCLAQLMVILDISIVNVALPAIHKGLHFSTTDLQWVVNAYTITFAGFLLLGGRASDLLGRRSVFIAGTAMFVIASLLCALANSRGLLIGARALQGLGGAVISPASLAIIATYFKEGKERSRALGAWAATGGAGGAVGVILGGVLTQGFGWPAIFIVNVPIGIGVILSTRIVVAPGGAVQGRRDFDLSGAVLVTAALTAFVFGIVRTDTLGWGATGVLAPLAGGVLLFAAFLYVEGRVARSPLMPLGLFRLARLRSANLIVFLLYSATFGMWYFLSLYLQEVLHDDPIATGLSFLPITLGIVASSYLAPRLVARYGERRVLTTGMLLVGAGLGLLTTVRAGGSYTLEVLPGGVIAALGAGCSFVPATIAAVSGVERSQSGLASGLINTSRLMGGALGLAALATIAASRTHAQLLTGVSNASALSSGFQLAFAIAAGLSLLGGLAAFVLLRSRGEVAAPQTGAAAAPLLMD
jgi:EmrB/QacA subfamily drug resistance transporter